MYFRRWWRKWLWEWGREKGWCGVRQRHLHPPLRKTFAGVDGSRAQTGSMVEAPKSQKRTPHHHTQSWWGRGSRREQHFGVMQREAKLSSVKTTASQWGTLFKVASNIPVWRQKLPNGILVSLEHNWSSGAFWGHLTFSSVCLLQGLELSSNEPKMISSQWENLYVFELNPSLQSEYILHLRSNWNIKKLNT